MKLNGANFVSGSELYASTECFDTMSRQIPFRERAPSRRLPIVHRGFTGCGSKLPAAALSSLGRQHVDATLAEQVVGQDQTDHGLDHRHSPWQDARVVSSLRFEHDGVALAVHRLLRL